MLRKITSLLLAMAMALSAVACTGEQAQTETETPTPPAEGALDLPLTEAYDTFDEDAYDVYFDGETIYRLTSSGIIMVQSDKTETLVTLVGFDPIPAERLIRASFTMHDHLFFVVYEGADGTRLVTYNPDGTQNAAPFLIASTYTNISNVCVLADTLYFIAGTSNGEKLLSMPLTGGEPEALDSNAAGLTVYDDTHIAYGKPDRSMPSIIILHTETLEKETLYFQSAHITTDALFGLGYDDVENNFYFVARSASGFYPLLTKMDAERLVVTPLRVLTRDDYYNANRVFLFETTLLTACMNKSIYCAKNYIDGIAEQEAPLRVLFVTDGYQTSAEIFDQVWGAVNLSRAKDGKSFIGYEMIPCRVRIEEPLGGPYLLDLAKQLESYGGADSFDLVLFEANLTRMLEKDDMLLDLATVPQIASQFKEMLPGVKDLCTVNGKLLGAPVICSTRGLAVNTMKLIAAGATELPAFDWTFADVIKMYNTIDPSKMNNTMALSAMYVMNPLSFSVGCNVLAGIVPTEEEYRSILHMYKETYDKNYLTDSDENIVSNALFCVSLSAYGLESAGTNNLVLLPRYVESFKTPVRMDVLSVLTHAADKPVVLEFAEAFVNREVLYTAMRGEELRGANNGDNVICLPLWYHYDDLLKKDSQLVNYEDMLANSVPQVQNDFWWRFKAVQAYSEENEYQDEMSTLSFMSTWSEYGAYDERLYTHVE